MKARRGSIAVEWDDGTFKFGVTDENAYEVTNVAPASAVGAAFLSGHSFCSVLNVSADGATERYSVFNSTVSMAQDPRIRKSSHLAICGEGVANPRIVADVCRQSFFRSVAVCPFVEAQAAFGYLAGSLMLQGAEQPHMTRFCEPWEESLDAEYKEFDLNLKGDGLGRMAHLIQARISVVNQMMKTPSIPAFYGRVLSTGRWWGKPIFLMLANAALKYFPTEPLALRNYAATWVPVAVKNTEEFKKVSDYEPDEVTIFVASELTPGLGTFLRFHETMCREDFVISSDPKSIPSIQETIPLFRSGRAYNVGIDLFREVVLNES